MASPFENDTAGPGQNLQALGGFAQLARTAADKEIMPRSHESPRLHHIDAKVSQLQALLLTTEDLAEVSNYFHEVLVPDDAFISTGTLSSNPRLITALQTALQRVVPEGQFGSTFMIHLEDQALFHGYAMWGSGHVVFFYFEQLDLGFCSYTPNLSSLEVTFVRFNLTDLTAADSWGAWPGAITKQRGILQ